MRQGAQIDKKYLHKILRNRIFLGEISHKGKWFGMSTRSSSTLACGAANHEVLAKDLAWPRGGDQNCSRTDALLRGLLYAPSGERMRTQLTRARTGKYHYYVSKSETARRTRQKLRAPARAGNRVGGDCADSRCADQPGIHRLGGALHPAQRRADR